MPLCLYSIADVLLLNNWAFDETLSHELSRATADWREVGGRAIVIRNPTPRYRPESSKGTEALAFYELPTNDEQIYDVPAGGIDWRHHAGVHWTALRALLLGVRQLDRMTTSTKSKAVTVLRKFCKMSSTLMY